jgi:[acyl-carrier-protein] S-malonyltransferase
MGLRDLQGGEMTGRREGEDLAFLFPGQGSQYPGMARELGACGPAARELVGRAEHRTGLPLEARMTRADAATIADPEVAQLLVFVTSCALLTELRERGMTPQVVAGHSLGEYTALVAAGMLDFDGALDLVAERGRAMARAAEDSVGAMAAIAGLTQETVEELCARCGEDGHGVLVVANHNSPRQTAVSGDLAAVRAVVELARQHGAVRARRLPVGGAYHSPLMAPAERRLRPRLEGCRLAPPRTPMVTSMSGASVTDPAVYRGELCGQITAPVHWDRTVAALLERGARSFVEVGPGRVLCGLGRDNAQGRPHLTAQEALRGHFRRAGATV